MALPMKPELQAVRLAVKLVVVKLVAKLVTWRPRVP